MNADIVHLPRLRSGKTHRYVAVREHDVLRIGEITLTFVGYRNGVLTVGIDIPHVMPVVRETSAEVVWAPRPVQQS